MRTEMYKITISQMTIEEHGGGKQLVRFRTWPIIYPMGLALIFLFAFLSLLAAVDQAWLVVTLLGTVTVGLVVHVFEKCATATAACRSFANMSLSRSKASRMSASESSITADFLAFAFSLWVLAKPNFSKIDITAAASSEVILRPSRYGLGLHPHFLQCPTPFVEQI